MLDPGLLIATGFCRRGFGIGPVVGRLLPDLVTGAAPSVDPATFRFSHLIDGSFPQPVWTVGCRRGQPPGSQRNA